MVWVYTAAFLISIVFGMLMLRIGRTINITYYSLLFFSISVACGGYLALAAATNLQAAIVGNTVAYFGVAFSMLFFQMGFSRLLQLNTPTPFFVVMGVLNIVLVGLVATENQNNLYYGDIALLTWHGAHNIEKLSYGPLHNMFFLIIFTYLLFSVYCIAASRSRLQKASYRNMLLLLSVEICVIVIYAIELAVPQVKVELIPFGFVMGESIALICVWRLAVFDMESIVQTMRRERSECGYILFDRGLRLIGCDRQAMEFYPALNKARPDRTVEKLMPELHNRLKIWRSNLSEEFVDSLPGGRELRCSAQEYRMQGRAYGYLVELYDDTAQLNLLHLQESYNQKLKNYNTELENQVQDKLKELTAMQDQIILGMAVAVGGRDDSTGDHVRRASYVVGILTDVLAEMPQYEQFSADYWNKVSGGSRLHDLGKISVPDRVLQKPGRYDHDEYEIMKTHASLGGDLVARVLKEVPDREYARVAENMARYHHEKWNGTGYPVGLKGEEIPFEARIMAVADVFDALVSRRCYKDAMPMAEAADLMHQNFGSHFDPSLAAVFDKALPRIEAFYEQEFAVEAPAKALAAGMGR